MALMHGPEMVMWIVFIGALVYLALTDYLDQDDDDDAS